MYTQNKKSIVKSEKPSFLVIKQIKGLHNQQLVRHYVCKQNEVLSANIMRDLWTLTSVSAKYTSCEWFTGAPEVICEISLLSKWRICKIN